MFKRGDLVTEAYPTCYKLRVGTVLEVEDSGDQWFSAKPFDAITGEPHMGYLGPYNPNSFKLIERKEKMMFEVGKQYKAKGGFGLRVVEVMAVTQKWAIVRGVVWESEYPTDFVGTEKVWEQSVFYNWEEYTPPKVTVQELTVRIDPVDGSIYAAKCGLHLFKERNIGKIRITHTEGQGLTVEVVG